MAEPVIKAVMTCKDLDSAPKTFRYDDYSTEPKMDGVRIYAVLEPGCVNMYTRSHRNVTHKLPHLADAMFKWSSGTRGRTILDGELVYHNAETGEVDFTKAMNVISGPYAEHAIDVQRTNNQWLTLMVFDCLEYLGDDIKGFFIEQRRTAVALAVRQILHPCLVTMPYVTSASPELIQEMTNRFGEGAVLKRRDSVYEMKRSGLWLKAKQEATADVVAMGAVMAVPGKFEGLIGALEFGQYRNGELFYRGKCSGMDDETRRFITEHLDEIVGDMRVFEVKHNGMFESELFRHPNFLRWRPDKDPQDCEWDVMGITVARPGGR